METTIIFSHSETGHVLEYFHHIFLMCEGLHFRRFVFVVPEGFEKLKKEQSWINSSNISFDYISEDEVKTYRGKSVFRISYTLSKILNNRILKYNADRVLSLFWFPIVPYGLFRFPDNVKVSIILYDVYLRELDSLSIQAKLRHKVNFWLLARSKKVERAFVLNDQETTDELNKLFHTSHFYALPDPYNPIAEDNLVDLRDYYGINAEKTIFAHFGGLSRRKGTLMILDAIEKLSDDERKHSFFIFAGRVSSDIKNEFYTKVKKLSPEVHIVVKDEFCSYAFLGSLCYCCSSILMPYTFANRSSGLLGYASQYHKPVIAPNEGLIGDLVEKYKLGITCNVKDAGALANSIRLIMDSEYEPPSSDYCSVNSVEKFCSVIKMAI